MSIKEERLLEFQRMLELEIFDRIIHNEYRNEDYVFYKEVCNKNKLNLCPFLSYIIDKKHFF